MPYLPDLLPKSTILITVKTYPLPSSDHGEVVCTAGLLNGEKWIRMYPISSGVYDEKKFPKYSWVELDLKKHPSDDRAESYMPVRGIDEPMRNLGRIGTDNYWAARKEFVFKEIYTSMDEMISLARSDNRSLGTLKPLRIIDFIIEESEREWKPAWRAKLRQLKMFDIPENGKMTSRVVIKKIPYTFKYRFLSEGDLRPRELSIHDWEIGTLYWNSLRQSDGDEEMAKALVRKKYFEDFVAQKDILLFLGTTYEFHKRRAENPFIIIGVFYPPKTQQLSLF